METIHQPVLLAEVLASLQIKSGQNYLDCTLGGGGYTLAIAQACFPGEVVALDADEKAIANFQERLKKNQDKNKIRLVQGNFTNLSTLIKEKFDGIVFDLGISSDQLEEKDRGFGFTAESLDMRLDQKQELTAEEIVNQWSEDELVKIFRDYGEEPLARPVAQAIIAARRDAALRSPAMLVQTIAEVYRRRYHRPSKINPATRVFMALRIAVNDELNNLSRVLPQAVAALKPNGRLAVVTFHSLEDRIVKDYFRQESKQCLCPPELPVCRCDHQATLKIITKKPLNASPAEIAQNPRSRSAKLRVAQKI